VVGAQAQAEDAVVESHPARQHEQADLGVQLAHPRDDVEAILVGQAQVEDDHGRRRARQRGPHVAGGGRDRDLVTEFLEEIGHVACVFAIVFNNQYLRHGFCQFLVSYFPASGRSSCLLLSGG